MPVSDGTPSSPLRLNSVDAAARCKSEVCFSSLLWVMQLSLPHKLFNKLLCCVFFCCTRDSVALRAFAVNPLEILNLPQQGQTEVSYHKCGCTQMGVSASREGCALAQEGPGLHSCSGTSQGFAGSTASPFPGGSRPASSPVAVAGGWPGGAEQRFAPACVHGRRCGEGTSCSLVILVHPFGLSCACEVLVLVRSLLLGPLN